MMNRIFLPLGVALALVASGASATEIDLECGVRNAPAGFGDELLLDFLEEEGHIEGDSTTTDDGLIALVGSCMGSEDWSEEEIENFVVYSMGRLASASAREALVAAGVRMDVLDQKLAISWGKHPIMPENWDLVLEREIGLELDRADKDGMGPKMAATYLGFYIAMYDEGARSLAALSE